MPYKTEWVDPELFLEHAGIAVFHDYMDDDYERELEHWFQVRNPMAETLMEPDFLSFDVRDLTGYIGRREDVLRTCIKGAIDNGQLFELLKIDDPRTNK